MTPHQVQLIQSSFESIAPGSDSVGALFYNRLFALDPSLRGMFPANMDEQIRKLMLMLTVAVRSLDRVDQLVPVLEDLGRRHAGYGVKEAHYATVGAALLGTLEQGLGNAFTAELREAWTVLFAVVAQTMQRGAATPAPSRAVGV